MPFFVIGYGVFYGIFAGIAAVFRFIITHPVISALIFLAVAAFGQGREVFHTGSLNMAAALSATPDTIEQYTGSPESCTNEGEVVCTNDTADVHMVGNRVTQIDYKRLNGSAFNNDDAFYHRVLTFLGVQYRDPDVTTIDKIVWNIPGTGTITVTSDADMNVEGIVIRG